MTKVRSGVEVWRWERLQGADWIYGSSYNIHVSVCNVNPIGMVLKTGGGERTKWFLFSCTYVTYYFNVKLLFEYI